MTKTLLSSLLLLAFLFSCSSSQKSTEGEETTGEEVVEETTTEATAGMYPVGANSVDQSFPFANVFFGFDSSEITGEAAMALDALAQFLAANPEVRISVIGKCDERGSDQYNLALGQRRAEAIKSELVNRGANADSVNAISAGETQATGNHADDRVVTFEVI